MKLSKGDAVTYVALVLSAGLQALEPLRKEAAMPPDSHPFLSSSVWSYIPLALLVLVGLIWLVRQIVPLFKNSPTSTAIHEVVNRGVEAPAPKPSLTPGERDRLSNVIYELAQLIQKQAPPLFQQAISISNQRRNTQLQVLKERLLVLQNDYVTFRSELFAKFIPDHRYYADDIMRLIGDHEAITQFPVELNEYLIVTDIAIGIPADKAETLTSLANGHMVGAANSLMSWVNACNERISVMRAALR